MKSIKDKITEEKEKRQAEIDKTTAKYRQAFNLVASTPEGLTVFRHIMDTCHYQRNNIVFNPQTGNINKDASDYLEARRSLYLEIRRHIDVKYLKQIEFSE